MSGYIVVSTPTIMDGTVVRWYRSEAAYTNYAEQLSASRNGVVVNGYLHEVPQSVLGDANEAYRLLRDRQDVTHLLTHRSGFNHRDLEPIEAMP